MLCIHQKHTAQQTVPMQPSANATTSKFPMENCITMIAKSVFHLSDNESARGHRRGLFTFNQNDVSRCNYGLVVVVVVSFVS